jgi:Zn-finger nucleic acid-binding protein
MAIVDRCLTCGGIWFDQHELRAVQKMATDAGWDVRFFLGFFYEIRHKSEPVWTVT